MGSKIEMCFQVKNMENVWNIRKKENLYFVLPEDHSKNDAIEKIFVRTAIIIYLYYEDSPENYYSYIDKIPQEIKTYIISSDQTVLQKIKQYAQGKKHISVMGKENRGRDVSALLVTARTIFLQYDYVCFVHDKRAKGVTDPDDFHLWVGNLWDNTLKSEEYIKNVLDALVGMDEIGLLVPSEPIGDEMNAWYANAWYGEYEETVKLARRLHVQANIERRYPPITLGTAFWCKTRALQKLFTISWSYSDFDEEPLPETGTLSHAVERIFAYVAQDAGYKTGMVMTCSYAAQLLSSAQDKMQGTYHFLSCEMNIPNYRELKKQERCRKAFREFADRNASIFLYGAGTIGKKCLKILQYLQISPEAVLVSKVEGASRMLEGVQVIPFASLSKRGKKIGIIVAVGKRLNDEVRQLLDDAGYHNYICYIEI